MLFNLKKKNREDQVKKMFFSLALLPFLLFASFPLGLNAENYRNSPDLICGYSPPKCFGDCCSFQGNVDYLYLKGKLGLDDFFLGGDFNSIQNIAIADIGLKEVYVDWDGGYDIGIGWNLPGDQWAIGLNWVHFNSRTPFSISSAGSNTSSLGTLSTSTAAPYTFPYGDDLTFAYTTVLFEVALNFDLLDLSLSRQFAVGPSLWLKPKAGILFLFARDSISLLSDFSAKDCNAQSRHQLAGAGILVGLETEWNIGCGLSFYGGLELGSVSYESKVDQFSNFTSGFTEVNSSGTSFKIEGLDPLFRYQLGGKWDVPLARDDMCFSIGLGWEAIFLLNQDLFVRYVFSEAKPLVLQGMSLSFSLSL